MYCFWNLWPLDSTFFVRSSVKSCTLVSAGVALLWHPRTLTAGSSSYCTRLSFTISRFPFSFPSSIFLSQPVIMSVSSLHSVSSWKFSAVGTIVSYHELSASFSCQHLLRFLGLITFSQAVPRTSDFIVIVLRCTGSRESGLLQTYVLNSIKYSTLLFELFPPRPTILHHHQDLRRKHSSWNRILAPSLVPCPPVSPEPRLC